jgi:hypothetical protein
MSFFYKFNVRFSHNIYTERLLEMEQKNIVHPPQISADTLEQMKNFFAATSIPRIIEARKELKEAK